MSKSKTLFSKNKNVDVSSILTNNNYNDKEKKIKKNYNFNKEIDNSEYSISDDENEEDEDYEEDEVEENEIIVNHDENDENDDIEDVNNTDDEESIGSNKNSDQDDIYSDNENKDDYIDNEDTLKNKCYSKYVRDNDDIDFDELFGDETLTIIKNIRLSKPILTKYERVRLLTDRTKQLAQGAKPMLKNINGLSSREIASLELKNKLIPLIIERPIPNSGVERWKLSELEIIDF